MLDSKRCLSQTQHVKFDFTPGGLYQNASSHLAVLIDSVLEISDNGVPYAGRGIALFASVACLERFGSLKPPLSGCKPFVFDAETTYTISVFANASHVDVWIDDANGVNLLILSDELPDIMPEKSVSVIAIAGVGDCPQPVVSGGKVLALNRCVLTISNIEHGHF